MQRYAFFPNCNKNMQNINHFLIFSNTFNPKHPPPPTKKKNPPQQNPLKKNPSAPSAPKIPHHKIPLKKIRVLRAAPSCSECSQNPPPQNPPQKNPSCSECSKKSPTKKILHPKKAKKKIATRQAGSNHHIKQLLSLNQKI